jgi:hypothetical protein
MARPDTDDGGLERPQLARRSGQELGQLRDLERAVQELPGPVRRQVGPVLALVEQHHQGAVEAVADLLVAEPAGPWPAVEDDGGHRRLRPVGQLGRGTEVGDPLPVLQQAVGEGRQPRVPRQQDHPTFHGHRPVRPDPDRMTTNGPMEPVIALVMGILTYWFVRSLYDGCTRNQAMSRRSFGYV